MMAFTYLCSTNLNKIIMNGKTLSEKYNKLEYQVMCELRKRIEKSKINSEFVSEKCIKVNVFDYVELAIINDRLTFLDSDGYHYNIYTECSLEDLIDILNKQNHGKKHKEVGYYQRIN